LVLDADPLNLRLLLLLLLLLLLFSPSPVTARWTSKQTAEGMQGVQRKERRKSVRFRFG